jgi:cytidine deaminase
MKREIEKTLVEAAVKALDRSYSPYSNFKVGAALLSKSGKVYTGANIESASFTPTVCAERVAFFSAIHSGETEFLKIAIVGGKNGVIDAFCPPCGVCRQVMTEFCDSRFEIILFDGTDYKVTSLGYLMPDSFTKSNI